MAEADAAERIGNTLPAAPAPPGYDAPRNAHTLVEYATARGWQREGTYRARGWVMKKVKAPPEEEGRKYSMKDQRVEVEQYIVRLLHHERRSVLVLIWHEGEFECAITNRPMGKYNFKTVKKFMRGE